MEETPQDLETDSGFPSGPWRGFYAYSWSPQQLHPVSVGLRFRRGRMSGEGEDDVGRFVIVGTYDLGSRRCWWTKTYPGSHSVQYAGQQSGRQIRGTWTIATMTGHFALWPGSEDELSSEFFVEEPHEAPAELPLISPGIREGR